MTEEEKHRLQLLELKNKKLKERLERLEKYVDKVVTIMTNGAGEV